MMTLAFVLPIMPLVRPTDPADTLNGRLTTPPLVQFPLPGRPLARMHHTAARVFRALFAEVTSVFGVELTCTSTPDCYRSFETQVSTFVARYTTTKLEGRPSKTWNGVRYWQRPGTAMAATPGTSNHGWGLAIDAAIAVPIETGGYASPAPITSRMDVLQWLVANAGRYGVSWESQSEAWHIRWNGGDQMPQAVLDYEAPEPAPPLPPDPPPAPPVPDPAPVPTKVAHVTVDLPYLRLGVDDQTAVGSLQTKLNVLAGQGLTVDNNFGNKTKAAVMNWQTVLKLTVDGEVGGQTWASLFAVEATHDFAA